MLVFLVFYYSMIIKIYKDGGFLGHEKNPTRKWGLDGLVKNLKKNHVYSKH